MYIATATITAVVLIVVVERPVLTILDQHGSHNMIFFSFLHFRSREIPTTLDTELMITFSPVIHPTIAINCMIMSARARGKGHFHWHFISPTEPTACNYCVCPPGPCLAFSCFGLLSYALPKPYMKIQESSFLTSAKRNTRTYTEARSPP